MKLATIFPILLALVPGRALGFSPGARRTSPTTLGGTSSHAPTLHPSRMPTEIRRASPRVCQFHPSDSLVRKGRGKSAIHAPASLTRHADI